MLVTIKLLVSVLKISNLLSNKGSLGYFDLINAKFQD